MTITNYSGLPFKFADDLSLDTLPPLCAFQYVLDDMTCIRRGVKCIQTNPASCWLETISEVRGRRDAPHFVVPQERIPDSFVSRITVTGIPPESYDAWVKSLPACVKHFSSKCLSPFAAERPKVTRSNSPQRPKRRDQSLEAPKRCRGPSPRRSKVVRIRGRTVRIPPYHDMHSPPSSLDEYVIDKNSLPVPTPRFRAKKEIPEASEAEKGEEDVALKRDDTSSGPEMMQIMDEHRLIFDMLQEKITKTRAKCRHLQRSVNSILETLRAQGILSDES